MRAQAPVSEPRSRAPSQTSTMSTASNMARKPVPPVPKKPALLTKPSDRRISQESRQTGAERTVSTTRPPATQRVPSDGPKGAFPSSPQRTTGGMPRPAPRQQPPPVLSPRPKPTRADGPPLPLRRTSASLPKTNDLMDDDNEGASAIPSLQPTRRP